MNCAGRRRAAKPHPAIIPHTSRPRCTGLRSKATRSVRYELAQDFEPFCRQFRGEEIDTGKVAAWPGQAPDQAQPNRVFGNHEDDRDGCRRLGRGLRCGTSACSDHGDLAANQFGRKGGQPIGLIIGPAIVDRYVLAFDITNLAEALAKSTQKVRLSVG